MKQHSKNILIPNISLKFLSIQIFLTIRMIESYIIHSTKRFKKKKNKKDVSESTSFFFKIQGSINKFLTSHINE